MISHICPPPPSCKVYTPSRLADAIVGVLRQNRAQKWLEPSCGKGVFLEAIRNTAALGSRVHGIDLDPETAEADQYATVLRGVDFLGWSRTRTNEFDSVLGNPPFVAIRDLDEPLRTTAADIQDYDGRRIGYRSNTWYAFVLQAVRLVRKGGGMAFVLPAACEYANYSKCGRSTLTRLFGRVDLIRSRTPLFDGVQEGSAVLVCRHKGGSPGLYRRHEVDNLDDVIARLRSLDRITARTCIKTATQKRAASVRLSEVLDIKLGGVTGDNGYFVLSESQRLEHRLPIQSVVPIVGRSRHINLAAIRRREWLNLKEEGERVWLFRPTAGLVQHEAVKKYLELATANGGCHLDRYKITNREPWYQTPLPRRVDGFITGMSSRGLWICMNELSRLKATNTLYVIRFRRKYARAQRYAWALSVMTSKVAKQVSRCTRIYPDGLSKIEPGQVGQIEVAVPPNLKDAVSIYRSAITAFLCGDKAMAHAIADEAICG